MAGPHRPIKNGARGNGAKHAQYIGREDRYRSQEDLVYLEDGNLPKWAENAEQFFKAADDYEQGDYTRKLVNKTTGEQYEKLIRGRSYKELEVSIPREAKDPIKWAKDFADESIGDKHPYRLAIHDKAASDGGRNIHMHLMFSTRTMDGHDRPAEKFFKDAAKNYRHRKTKEMVMADPAKGGAKKSTYWDSPQAVVDHHSRFERHVQRVAPDFKLERSESPEPKIGPSLKKAGKEYTAKREERLADVNEMRKLKMVRGIVDKEIEKEQAREQEAEKPKSRTDDLWAQLEAKKGPQIDTQPRSDRPADQPTWREFVSQKKAEQRQQGKAAQQPQKEETKPADWSRFKGVAGSQGNEQPAQRKDDKMNPMNTLPSGPGYFPESKVERAQNAAEAPALQRLDREKNDRSEAQEQGHEKGREKSVSDDLWERMNQERAEKEQRDRDRDDSMDMDR